MNVIALIMVVIKISIILSVLAIGLKATPGDLGYLFRRPALLGRAVLAMYIIMPIVAFLIVLSFDLNPVVKIALVVLSVSPIPPILPNKAFKAGCQENYTIGLLVDISILAILFIPITLNIFELLIKTSLGMKAMTIAWQVFATIIAPLLVGIAIRVCLPSFADRVAKPLSLVAIILLVLSFLPILFGSLRQMLSLIGDGTLISMAAFALIGLIVGHFLGGPDPENKPVLALATASRHPAIAIGIAHANFPNQKLAVPAVLLYLLLSAILSAPYLNWVKSKTAPTSSTKKQMAT